MDGKERSGLSEPMFYTLMAFLFGEKCGMEVMDFVYNFSGGRVTIWPGTLYAILARCEAQGMICEVETANRKRIYAITDLGRRVYQDEVARLCSCVDDARRAVRPMVAREAQLRLDELEWA